MFAQKDVKKMLLQQARTVYWKKWAAKHEYEELKEGIWLWPCCARRRRNSGLQSIEIVARKFVLEGGWVQKKLYDIGWSDESECQACHEKEGTEKHRLYHCPGWNEVRRQIAEARKKRKLLRKSGSGKGVLSRTLSVKAKEQGHFSITKWESEKHRSWGIPAEGFKGHVATDGSLLGIAGMWGACGWAGGVVQLDYDEEMGPLHGMYGSKK